MIFKKCFLLCPWGSARRLQGRALWNPITLKGQCVRHFLLLVFFHESVGPKPLSIPLGPFRIFSQLKVDHQYQRHWWQICLPCQRHRRQNCRRYQRHRWQICHRYQRTGGKFCHQFHQCCWYRGVNNMASNLPLVSTTPLVNFELRISPQIFKKIETVLMGYSRPGGKLIDEKNQKRKISWHCPFKVVTNEKWGGPRSWQMFEGCTSNGKSSIVEERLLRFVFVR